MIGTYDLVMGLVLVTVLFGAKRLPELAKSLGTSMKEFKKGINEVEDAASSSQASAPAATSAPAQASSAAPVALACKGCGGSIQAGWKHCPACGAATD